MHTYTHTNTCTEINKKAMILIYDKQHLIIDISYLIKIYLLTINLLKHKLMIIQFISEGEQSERCFIQEEIKSILNKFKC